MTHTRLVRNMTIGGAAAAALALLAATPASAETTVPEPDRFTSAFTVMATPDQVLNADGVATPASPARPAASTSASTPRRTPSATTSPSRA
ncbi:hypothetical protein CMMCA002_00775 [Clavibacter michiganensis subsp. michiganensis]|nr:hypothetical protein [Clavibacter michiganensis]OUE14664.1 hypothetical protein CMMCA002_00775 [Clavibacter michiganensis subsp. michiganensis]